MPKKSKKKEVKQNLFEEYYAKIKLLFFEPASFFESVKNEKEYWPILQFLIIVMFLTGAAGFLVRLPFITLDLIQAPSIWIELAGVMLSPLGVFFIFIGVAFVHLGVLLFGGRQGFFNTFKPIAYATAIGIVYSLMITMISTPLEAVFPFDAGALESGDAAFGDIPLFFILLVIPLGIISFIHMLYAEVIGLSYFHNISKIKAILATIIPFMVLFLLLVLIGFFFALIFASFVI